MLPPIYDKGAKLKYSIELTANAINCHIRCWLTPFEVNKFPEMSRHPLSPCYSLGPGARLVRPAETIFLGQALSVTHDGQILLIHRQDTDVVTELRDIETVLFPHLRSQFFHRDVEPADSV